MPFGEVVPQEGAEGSFLLLIVGIVIHLSAAVVVACPPVVKRETHVIAIPVLQPHGLELLVDHPGCPPCARKLHDLWDSATLAADEGTS